MWKPALLFCCFWVSHVHAQAYKPQSKEPPQYHGPTFNLNVEALEEIPLGYFGPSDSTHAEGGTAWLCAQKAIQKANQEGGLNGKPFRLVPAWSENPWGSGIAQVTRLAYVDHIWGLIGSINGHATHLVEQVATKARFPVLDPGSTDLTVNQAQVPWIFSLLPSDQDMVQAMVQPYMQKKKDTKFILISSLDHDARSLTRLFLKTLAKHGQSPDLHLELGKSKNVVATVMAHGARELVLLTNASDSMALVRELDRTQKTFELTGGPALTLHPFLKFSQTWTGSLQVPLLYETSPKLRAFMQAFKEKHGENPDAIALATYDAIHLMTDAIRRAQPNRKSILQVLRTSVPFDGITGTITWQANGRNSRKVVMGTLEKGQLK